MVLSLAEKLSTLLYTVQYMFNMYNVHTVDDKGADILRYGTAAGLHRPLPPLLPCPQKRHQAKVRVATESGRLFHLNNIKSYQTM